MRRPYEATEDDAMRRPYGMSPVHIDRPGIKRYKSAPL
jgi:hypothetical protein